jgi:hypothetical protein
MKLKNTFYIINLTVKINYKYLYTLKSSWSCRWSLRGRKIPWRSIKGRIMIGHVCQSPPIAFYFVLHTFSPFKPSGHQFVLQQTLQRLVMVVLSWIVGAYYWDITTRSHISGRSHRDTINSISIGSIGCSNLQS